MLKRYIKYIFVCMLGCLAVIASPGIAHAHGGVWGFLFANLDAGWETMRLDAEGYERNHHGMAVSLAAGMNLWCFMGLGIEQDLGFIALKPKVEGAKTENLFKGATFLTWPLFSPPMGAAGWQYPDLMAHVKLGLGAIYMKAPEGSGKNMQAWFAFRPTVAFLYYPDEFSEGEASFGCGLEFAYTLAYAPDYVFDHRDLVHFFVLKAKFIVAF